MDSTQRLADRTSKHISTSPYSNNHIRIITLGAEGWLFINGTYVDKLDLSGRLEAGSVSAIGSYFAGDGIAGKSTLFSNFTVRPLHKVYGPRDASIEHNPDDGFIDEYDSSQQMADGIIEARFHNPYSTQEGNWSSGFLFRNGSNGFHAVVIQEFFPSVVIGDIVIDGFGRWYHHLRTGDVDSTQELADGIPSHISTGPSDSNHIRIIALGEEGWLFINGNYEDKLDLSGLLEAGRVSAVGSYFAGHGIVGRSTRFEEFTIWSAGDAP